MKFLYWLTAPVLWVLLAAPVFIAHFAAHVLIDRMRRRPGEVDGSKANRTDTRRATRAWAAPMLREASSQD
jgi:hypothetical protein